MLVQENKTKKEFEMVWVNIDPAKALVADKIIASLCRAPGEGRTWKNNDAIDLQCRVVLAERKIPKLLARLSKKGGLTSYTS